MAGQARTGSFWLCYKGPLSKREKNGIQGNRRRPKVTSWEKNSWGSWKKKDEEEEPTTERRREYTDLGVDLDARKEKVVCHVSAMALAMIDEARREAEM